MKMKKENQIGLKSQEDAFREKAGHYLVCFVDQCPLHDHCLRWLVGQYVDIQPWPIMPSTRVIRELAVSTVRCFATISVS
jgi:hypothetical protein